MNDDATLHDGTLHDEDLRVLAQRLGAGAAERLDVEATARGVLARLAEQPARRPRWVQPAWLRVAAALVVLLGGGLLARGMLDDEPQQDAVALAVGADLAELDVSDLEGLLASLDEVLVANGPAVNGDLHDLTADELFVVLRSLEG